jgi:sugar lactone lactonase YvrE
MSTPRRIAPADEPQTSGSQDASDLAASAPQTIEVTSQGDVLVLDSDAAQVRRHDARGQLLATYPAAELAGLEIADLAVSPDGRTLYVVDAASNRLRVISLTGDEEAGEEE